MANIKLFENKKIRSSWNAEEEEWYFSVVDIVEVLTESNNSRRYWSDLKRKLTLEGSELYEKIVQLKLESSDGKKYSTDVLKTSDILRLIQSIPSPKAEPFKLWLAEVGNERLEEIADPQKAMDRAIEYYRAKGYPEEWIKQRLQTIDMRRELTEQYHEAGITEQSQFAILTNEMTKAWSGHSVQEYKAIKGLKKESLRDNMTNLELALNMLAEVTTTALCKNQKPVGFNETKKVSIEGGQVAGNARIDIENRLGQSVISPINSKTKEKLIIETKNKEDK